MTGVLRDVILKCIQRTRFAWLYLENTHVTSHNMTWKHIPTLKSISTVFGLLTFLFIVSDYLLTPEAKITCQENLKSSSSIRIPRRCNGVMLYENDFVLITKPVLVPLRSGLFPNPFVPLIILSPIILCIVIILL